MFQAERSVSEDMGLRKGVVCAGTTESLTLLELMFILGAAR